MESQSIYILCGVIGSGKSTWAKAKAEECGAIIINKDAIRSMLHGGKYAFVLGLEPLVSKMVEAGISEALSSGHSVIIDECHLTVAKRENILLCISKVAGLQAKRICVRFKNGPECLQRRRSDPRGVDPDKWTEIYEGMMRDFQEPSITEGFDDIWQEG